MDDVRTRRDLGLICIGAVLLLVGLLRSNGDEESSSISTGVDWTTVFLATGFWICAVCLVRIGLRLIRSR